MADFGTQGTETEKGSEESAGRRETRSMAGTKKDGVPGAESGPVVEKKARETGEGLLVADPVAEVDAAGTESKGDEVAMPEEAPGLPGGLERLRQGQGGDDRDQRGETV